MQHKIRVIADAGWRSPHGFLFFLGVNRGTIPQIGRYVNMPSRSVFSPRAAAVLPTCSRLLAACLGDGAVRAEPVRASHLYLRRAGLCAAVACIGEYTASCGFVV